MVVTVQRHENEEPGTSSFCVLLYVIFVKEEQEYDHCKKADNYKSGEF